MAALTSPMAAAGAGVAQARRHAMATAPFAAGAVTAEEMIAAVQSGIATQYWVELLAYPPGTARSLWLLVNNVWKRYDNSPAHWEDMVQRAFIGGSTVRVWFDGEVIVGLVVSS